MKEITQNNFTLTEELELVKYTTAVKSISLEDLQDLFISLLILKLNRDVYFKQQFKQEVGLHVPSIGDPQYSHPLTNKNNGTSD